MGRSEILNQTIDVFKHILDNEAIVLNDATTANDIEEWDSLNHMELVVALEKNFKIRFTSREIQSWKNVGEMIDCIESKLQPA